MPRHEPSAEVDEVRTLAHPLCVPADFDPLTAASPESRSTWTAHLAPGAAAVTERTAAAE
jgi:hypothetical protein